MRVISQILLYVVVAYTSVLWFRNVRPARLPTLNEVHLCMLNVDELHCEFALEWLGFELSQPTVETN